MLGQYTTIPNILFSDRRLMRSAIIVFGVLQSHSGINGEIYPSYETIAEEGQISKRTAIRAVNQLEKYGYLIKMKGTFSGGQKQASNYYFLNPNPRFLKVKSAEEIAEKNEKSYAKVMQSYATASDTDVTPHGCQNVTPNNNRNEYKKCACISNIYNNNTIHAHEDFPTDGEKSTVPPSCERENFIGHDCMKKLPSAFGANGGFENCGKIISKNGFRLIQGGKHDF